MNEKDFSEKLDELLKTFTTKAKEDAMRLYRCGGIDTESFGNDFWLPRILLTVALENAAKECRPGADYAKTIENLRKF